MTSTIDVAAGREGSPQLSGAGGARAGRGARVWVARCAPWLAAGSLLVVTLIRTGTPAADVVGYLLYWTVGIAASGTLVHRAIRGSRGNLPEDIGYGAATGLLIELVGWSVSAWIGLQRWLWLWPVLVLSCFVVIRPLRRHWRIENPRPLSHGWSWAVATVMAFATLWAAATWLTMPLPPVTTDYVQDLYYHLALVHEMTRTMPFKVPQMFGEPLRYHYLSDAHMASASMITGIPPTTVLIRLWGVPVIMTSVLVTAALARELTGRSWTGPVAAVLSIMVPGLLTYSAAPMLGPAIPISLLSPSLTFAIPLMLLLAAICVDLVRGERLGAAWLVVPLLALACAGAKASALPLIIAGVGAAAVVQGVQRRAVPWPTVAAFSIMIVCMVLGFRLFAGGGAGVLTLDPLKIVTFFHPYAAIVKAHPALNGTLRLLFFVLGVLSWWALLQLPALAGLAALGRRRSRGRPETWFIATALLAGATAMWTFSHVSASQLYFWRTAAPFGALLTVLLVSDATPRGGRQRWLVLAGLAGAATGWLAELVSDVGRPDPTMRAWAIELARPFLILAVVVLTAVAVWVGVRNLRPRMRGWGLAVGSSALVGAGLFAAATVNQPGWNRLASERLTPHAVVDTQAVTVREMRAALWLDAHAPAEAVVATNVHCRPVRTRPHCASIAFWVSGLGGRRTLLESWTYTDEVVKASVATGVSIFHSAAPDTELFDLNERFFAAPTEEDAAVLRDRYGVRWLFADTRAGTVSAELEKFATLRYTAGPVTIFELNAP